MADSPDCDTRTVMVLRFRSAVSDTLRRVKTLIPRLNQLLEEQRAHEQQLKSRKATTTALGVVAATLAVVVLTSTGFALASPAALLLMGGATLLGLLLIDTVVGWANESSEAEDPRKNDNVWKCVWGYEADQLRLKGIMRRLQRSLCLLTGVHRLDERTAVFISLVNPETFDITDTHFGMVRRDRLQGLKVHLEHLFKEELDIVAVMCYFGGEEKDPRSQSSAAGSGTTLLKWDLRIRADVWILMHRTVEPNRTVEAAWKICKSLKCLRMQNEALETLSGALTRLVFAFGNSSLVEKPMRPYFVRPQTARNQQLRIWKALHEPVCRPSNTAAQFST